MKGERYSEKESAAETMRERRGAKERGEAKNKTAGAGEIVFRVLCFILSFCLLALSGVEAATQFSDSAWEQWTPDYEKADLTDVLEKGAGNLTEEDYSLIYAQTGLTKIGTDRLLEKGDRNKIARIQESYFKKREVVRERFAPWTCWEKIEDDYAVIGEVRAGDNYRYLGNARAGLSLRACRADRGGRRNADRGEHARLEEPSHVGERIQRLCVVYDSAPRSRADFRRNAPEYRGVCERRTDGNSVHRFCGDLS